MEHCRLTAHVGTLTVAAIDSVIERGALSDWIELRAAALARPKVFADLRRLCQLRSAELYDPFVDGHRAWLAYMDSAMTKDKNCSMLRQAFTDSGGQL